MLFSPRAAHIRKADILRVALGQQCKAGLASSKAPCTHSAQGRVCLHRQTRAVRLVKGIAAGTLFACQQTHKPLHHGAGTGAYDVLPGRRIACVTGQLPTGS